MNSRVALGAVVLVEIPYLDGTQAVKRSALVVSDSSQLLDVIVAGITSRIRSPLPPSHYVVNRSHADWSSSGLKLDSAVRCDRLFTVEESAISRVIGTLSPSTMLEIQARLRRVMGMK